MIKPKHLILSALLAAAPYVASPIVEDRLNAQVEHSEYVLRKVHWENEQKVSRIRDEISYINDLVKLIPYRVIGVRQEEDSKGLRIKVNNDMYYDVWDNGELFTGKENPYTANIKVTRHSYEYDENTDEIRRLSTKSCCVHGLEEAIARTIFLKEIRSGRKF